MSGKFVRIAIERTQFVPDLGCGLTVLFGATTDLCNAVVSLRQLGSRLSPLSF
jgi:hypothetical protein